MRFSGILIEFTEVPPLGEGPGHSVTSSPDLRIPPFAGALRPCPVTVFPECVVAAHHDIKTRLRFFLGIIQTFFSDQGRIQNTRAGHFLCPAVLIGDTSFVYECMVLKIVTLTNSWASTFIFRWPSTSDVSYHIIL